MNRKGIDIRDKLFIARVTKAQRENIYKAAKSLGMSGADFLIMASEEKLKEIKRGLRQNKVQNDDANVMAKTA